MSAPRVITLTEYETCSVPESHITDEEASQLWEHFKDKIDLETPSFKTGRQWELRSKGWVGYLVVSDTLHLALKPKVSLKNLFGMWEYAYRFRQFNILDDVFASDSLDAFYEQLAGVLAKRALDRARQGLYREYLDQEETLPYVRGRIDLRDKVRQPWTPDVRCAYQEHTANIAENQILAWTLYAILRSGIRLDRVVHTVRTAYRAVGQVVDLQPLTARDCVGRVYNRLNQDYHVLHALCRFFLDNLGPTYNLGERTMLPFLVNMAGLFELFVAEWLREHLPARYELRAQENVDVGDTGALRFRIDLVISDRKTGRPVCVLDTKYKRPDVISTGDFSQVVTYALLKDTTEAVLVYPDWLNGGFEATVGDVRVRGLTFSLAGDLEQAGQVFLAELLAGIDEGVA
ncbi:MAG: hypothetical protein Kow0077_29020 [Anaerolineae bacterium]